MSIYLKCFMMNGGLRVRDPDPPSIFSSLFLIVSRVRSKVSKKVDNKIYWKLQKLSKNVNFILG